MSIIETACPNCNRIFQYDDCNDIISCSHCGYQFWNRTTSSEKCYEGLELAEALSKLIEPVKKKKQLEKDRKKLETELIKAKKEIKTDRTLVTVALVVFAVFLVLAIIGAVIVVVFKPFTLNSDTIYTIMALLIFTFTPLAFFFSFRPSLVKNERILRNNPVFIKTTDEDLKNTNDILYSLGYESIPEEYKSEEALLYFCDVLSNRQANTLSEAIKLYNISKNLKKPVTGNMREQVSYPSSQSLNPVQHTGSIQKSHNCPKCGNSSISIICEQTTSGSGYNVGSGICGTICLGPIGVLCGMSGGKKIINTQYYICNSCKYKWRV
ncbi:MAG: hypothetical protein J5829_07370 [Lachnospiraceae bacterium]|nr:hypothetical protein [Lachnospiraceae bacterium]